MSQHESPGDAQGPSTPAAHAVRSARGARLRSWLVGSMLVLIYSGVALGLALLAATSRPAYLPATQGAASQILDNDGQPLARIFAESHLPVRLSEVPVQTIYALLAAEDADFFAHKGLDWSLLLREAQHPLGAQSVRGTITEQLVRMNWPDDHPTLLHTLRDSIRALRVERAYDKYSLLERYLNSVYFGSGAYGLGAAAQLYFGIPVSKLTPAESVALAGVIDMPGEGNPCDNLQPHRQQEILAEMLRRHWLSSDDYDDAVHEPIHALASRPVPWPHPYVVDVVRQQLIARYGHRVVYRRGLLVATTIDAREQAAAEQVLLHTVHLGSAQQVSTGALAAIEPRSGAIRALVGGVNFAQSQYNRAMLAHRQPGSAFNVFVYQAALAGGHLPFEQVLDAPVTVDNWSPKNIGNRYLGMVSLRQALAFSLDSVAVRLTQQLTPPAVVDAAHRAGIRSALPSALPIALGGVSVTPLEMARAFATYANAGSAIDAGLIQEIRVGHRVLYRQQPKRWQAVPPSTAFLLTQALQQVMVQGAGKSAALGRPAAGNAGRDSDDRNAWFIGYTPDLCAAVWLGNDGHRPMTAVDGGTLPAQAWRAFMTAAHRGVPSHAFPVPADVKLVTLCADSHQLALPTCPHHLQEYLPLAQVPNQPCALHYWVTRTICVASGKLARPQCPVTVERKFAYNAVPTEYCTLTHAPAPAPQPAAQSTPGAQPTPTVSQPAPVTPPSTDITPSKHAATPANANKHALPVPAKHAATSSDTNKHALPAPATRKPVHAVVKHHHAKTASPSKSRRPHATVAKPAATAPKPPRHTTPPRKVTPPPAATDNDDSRAKQVPDEKVQQYAPSE